jgi:hypothetical protein
VRAQATLPLALGCKHPGNSIDPKVQEPLPSLVENAAAGTCERQLKSPGRHPRTGAQDCAGLPAAFARRQKQAGCVRAKEGQRARGGLKQVSAEAGVCVQERRRPVWLPAL